MSLCARCGMNEPLPTDPDDFCADCCAEVEAIVADIEERRLKAEYQRLEFACMGMRVRRQPVVQEVQPMRRVVRIVLVGIPSLLMVCGMTIVYPLWRLGFWVFDDTRPDKGMLRELWAEWWRDVVMAP